MPHEMLAGCVNDRLDLSPPLCLFSQATNKAQVICGVGEHSKELSREEQTGHSRQVAPAN